MNIPNDGEKGKSLSIAVVDSIYDATGFTHGSLVTGSTRNYIASQEPLTTTHGYYVLNTIAYYSPESLYELHRVVTDDGTFTVTNYLKAMRNIRDSSVDIANVSAGTHHSDCKQQCRVCKAAEEVVSSGTILVTGSGNNREGEDVSLFCPALSDSTISVGSYEGVCGFTLGESGQAQSNRLQPMDIKPPGAYWVSDEAGFEDEPVGVPFCSLGGCTPRHSCEEHRIERIPDRNVSFTKGEPDVFAPDHVLYERETGAPGLKIGTSFATATVTGALGDLLSVISQARPLPSPGEVNTAIAKLATPVGNTLHKKFDAKEVAEQLL